MGAQGVCTDELRKLGPQIAQCWEGYEQAESDFCPELCHPAWKPRATFQVPSGHVWKTQNISVSTGSSVSLKGSAGLNEKRSHDFIEQVESFSPTFPFSFSAVISVKVRGICTDRKAEE